MLLPNVMSRAEVDETTLAEIAEVCRVSVDQIEDVYSCTPLQMEMIAGTRAEVFHIVLSFGPAADIERFCKALRHIVFLNPVLRTRFVNCRLGILQVITSEEHVTKHQPGDIEQYLGDSESHHRLALGAPVFHSTFINNKFVATIDHTIMDYWSLTTFLTDDIMAVYNDHPPKTHPPFKEFVAYCMAIEEFTAKPFWASRFKVVPDIFPKVKPGISPRGRQKMTQKIELNRIGDGVSPTHLPLFIEAAWALTTGVYGDSESVAFGIVLSGRSSTLNGIEKTLGPTIAEVPVQVNLQRTMTVEQLIKNRATSLRQLQIQPDLQYGIRRISAVSEAARIASEFQTLLNIRPAVAIAEAATDEFINFERLVWPFGPFALDLICSLLDRGILVEARFDPAILCERQMSRVLNQFEYTLQLLMEVPLQTKLGKLQLLNPHDYSEILQWNRKIQVSEQLTPESPYPESVGTPDGHAFWIVNPQNTNELTPIGGTGELLIEISDAALDYSNNKVKTRSFISPPSWASLSDRKGKHNFYRTGHLSKYNPNGSISFIGKLENRVKLGGQKIQLEELESAIASCAEVRDIVVSTKISAGRTHLLAVVCLADPQLPRGAVLQKLPSAYTELAEECLSAIRTYVGSRLPSHRVPTIWLAVEELPRTVSEGLDRAVIREWLRSQKISL